MAFTEQDLIEAFKKCMRAVLPNLGALIQGDALPMIFDYYDYAEWAAEKFKGQSIVGGDFHWSWNENPEEDSEKFGAPIDNGDGTVTINNATVNIMYQYANEILSQLSGYTIIKDCGINPRVHYAKHLTGDNFNTWMDFFYTSSYNSKPIQGRFLTDTDSTVCYFLSTDNYYYKSNNVLVPMTKNDSDLTYHYMIGSTISHSDIPTLPLDRYANKYTGTPFKLFNSFADLQRYISETQNFYCENAFHDIDLSKDLSLKFDKNLYNNTDWESLNNIAYNNVTKNITDLTSMFNGTPSDTDMQAIIKDICNSVSNAIASGTGQIAELINLTTAEQLAWLKRIYTNQEDLSDDLAVGLDSIGTTLATVITKCDEIISKMP